MDRTESGNAFLAEILARIPEDRRAAVEAVLPDLAPHVGDGVLRQATFSSELDRLKRVESEQTQWWDTNKALVDTGRKAAAAGFDPAKPSTTSALPDDVIRAEQLEQRERLYATVNSQMIGLATRHMREFGEDLDLDALMADPRCTQIGLKGVYEAKFGERFAAKAKAAQEADIAKQVEAGVAERMKIMRHPSFPVSGEADTSPLAALAPIKGNVDVDDLVDEYNTLVSSGGAR